MRNISYFKKILLFLEYKRSLRKISKELQNGFNLRIDRASRLYTVISLPPSLIEEPYNLRKEDIDDIAKSYIQDYTKKLSTFLNSKNLMELYDFYEVKKVEKYSYLVIYGFSLFNSAKFTRNYYIFIIIILLIMSASLLINFSF